MARVTNRATRTAQLGTRLLTRYSELESYLKQFAEGIYRFLWVMGRPGVGKTEAAAAAVWDRRVLYVKSARVSALSLYVQCYEHLNEPVVLDMDEMTDVLREPDWRRSFVCFFFGAVRFCCRTQLSGCLLRKMKLWTHPPVLDANSAIRLSPNSDSVSLLCRSASSNCRPKPDATPAIPRYHLPPTHSMRPSLAPRSPVDALCATQSHCYS
jgi:hypothetical protein